MASYQIISDGSCDLEITRANEMGVDIVPFYVQFLDEDYKKEGVELNVRDFYQSLVDNPNVFPKSSLPPVSDYIEMFKKYLDKGLDIICLCITAKFSGSYQAALNAKEILANEYKDRNITVIDTRVNTVLQGLVVKEAVRLRDNGYAYDDLVKAIYDHLDSGRIFFTISGLSYLKHGGRIGKVSSIIGDLLKISPIITLKEGEIFSSGVAISRVRGLAKVKSLIQSYIKEFNCNPDDYIMALGYGYDINEGKKYLLDLNKLLPDYQIDFEQIGSAIAVHTGPHALGIAVIKKFDK